MRRHSRLSTSFNSEALVSGNTVEDANGNLWQYNGSGANLRSYEFRTFTSANGFTSIPSVEDDPTIDGQVTFDQQEVSSIQGQLLAQDLAVWQFADGSSSPTYSAGATFELVTRTIQVIDIPAFSAQAGQINIYSDQVEGTGILNAPISANVTITNNTEDSLQIDGINIPQLLGGIYVNGALLTETNGAAVQPWLRPRSPRRSSKLFSSGARPTQHRQPERGEPGIIRRRPAVDSRRPLATPHSASSRWPPRRPRRPRTSRRSGRSSSQTICRLRSPITENGQLPNPPDIIIDGNITALDADLHVTDNIGNIDITAPIIQVDNEYITAKDNLTFNEINFFASGDPAAQLLSSELGTPLSLNPISQSQIGTYDSASPVVSDDAQTIEINAEVVDLNGSLVAGDATQTWCSIPTTALTNEIAEIQKEGLTGLVALNSVSTNDYVVYYNTANNSLEVDNTVVAGGVIAITGAVYSTSQASLNAFGYYGAINITNNTSYNLIVNKLDVSTPGAGVINITDLNYTTTEGGVVYALDTTYLSQQSGGMQIQYQYIDPLTGNILFQESNGTYVGVNTSTTNANNLPNLAGLTQVTPAGTSALQSSNSSSTDYNPLSGARYTFSVAESFQTTITRQYQTSSWLGIIGLGNSTNYSSQTEVTSAAQIEASSEYFYVDTNWYLLEPNGLYQEVAPNTPGAVQDPNYLYTSTTDQLNTTGFQPTANWSTSTWYGKKTYYQTDTEINGNETIVADSIRADLPVGIKFTGNTTASINITSDTSVTLLGNLNNVNGSTSITSGGSITMPNPGNLVEGTQISLTAAGSIGTSGQPINVELAGTSGQSFTASTTNGGIYVNAPQGALVINAVDAGGDQAVSLTSELGMTGFNSSNLITGGNVTLDSGGIVGAVTTPINLDVGQEAADQLNLTAKGDVYVTQESGNLPLFALNTTGQADIVVDNGSLVNVNTNEHIDPRTEQQLESGVWSELQLTGTEAQTKIQDTLNEYQLTQDQQYQAYWADVDLLEANGLTGDQLNPTDNSNLIVPLSSSDMTYYTNYFTAQGQAQGLVGSSLTNFVSNEITTTEATNTLNYDNLFAVYGQGGTYNPFISTASGGNTYDAEAGSSGANIVFTAGEGTSANETVLFGNVGSGNNEAGTITLANGSSWAALGYAVGQSLYISSASDPNANTAGNPYYTIAAVNGAVVTLVAGQTLAAETGTGNAGVTVGVANGNVTTANGAVIDTYNPNVYDPNFTYLLTSAQKNTLTNSIYVPTVNQLLSGISAGLLETTTSTQLNIEAANITATNIIITAANGNIGSLINPVTSPVEYVPGQNLQDGSTDQLALASANRTDLNLLQDASISATVNFASSGSGANEIGTMTLSSGTWANSGLFSADELASPTGLQLYIGGSANATTTGGDFLTIQSISGSTVTFQTGTAITAGTNQSVTLELALVPLTVNFGSTSSGANQQGTMTLSNGDTWADTGLFTQAELSNPQNLQLFIGGSTQNASDNTGSYLTVESISADGKTITFKSGQNVYTENSQTILTAVVIGSTDQSTLSGATVPTQVIFGDTGSGPTEAGTVTLANGGSWLALGYSEGEGIFLGSPSNVNANGASFNTSAPAYYTIASIGGTNNSVITLEPVAGKTFTPSVSTSVAAVANGALSGALTAADVIYSSANGVDTITLASGANWTSLAGFSGITSGDGIFISSNFDANSNGASFTGSNDYTIASINGDQITITLASNQTFTAGAIVNASPVTISGTHGSTSTLTAAPPVTTEVSFNNTGAGTITLSYGGSWASLGYSVGGGIYIQGTGTNGNGASFTGSDYYTIASINGDELTLQNGQTLTAGTDVTFSFAPVTISASPTAGATTSQEVTFGNSGNNTAGTVTRADGQNWSNFGYTVGNGIFIGTTSSDPNANGTSFSDSSPSYYTITAINGDVLTVTAAQPNAEGNTFVVEDNATIEAAPVTIDINPNASAVGMVLVTQDRDVAVAPTGTVTAEAGGFIFLGSQVNLNLNTIVAGADARIKTQGDVVNDSSGAISVADGPVQTGVTFGDNVTTTNGTTVDTGTITLTQSNGPSWAELGYEVGDGIFITGGANSEGANFNANAPVYYTIAAISGDKITLATGESLVAGTATVGLAPVTISINDNIDHSYLTPAGRPTQVTFGDTTVGQSEAGTITLASGTWASSRLCGWRRHFRRRRPCQRCADHGSEQQLHAVQPRAGQSVLHHCCDQRRRDHAASRANARRLRRTSPSIWRLSPSA